MYSRKTEKQRGRLETREYYYKWLIKRNKEWKEVKGIGASILATEENGKKQDIEQKCGKKLKYFKEISNLNTRRVSVQKEI